MSLDTNERAELIRYRLDESKETIQDVQLLLENDRLRAAVNIIYYGIFYSLLALGLAYEFEISKHQQFIGWFNRNFIHNGYIDSRFGKLQTKLQIAVQKGIMRHLLSLKKRLSLKCMMK